MTNTPTYQVVQLGLEQIPLGTWRWGLLRLRRMLRTGQPMLYDGLIFDAGLG